MSKEQRERFALGQKMGENCQKQRKIRIFRAIHSYFCEPFTRIMSKSLTSLFFKEQIAHGHFLKWTILSKRVKIKRENPQHCYLYNTCSSELVQNVLEKNSSAFNFSLLCVKSLIKYCFIVEKLQSKYKNNFV